MAQTAVKSLLESSYYSLSHFTNLLHALFRSPALTSKAWGSKVTAYKLPLNIEAGVRLSLVLFKLSTCSKHVEMYLQSLFTTIVFLGLQTFQLAKALKISRSFN